MSSTRRHFFKALSVKIVAINSFVKFQAFLALTALSRCIMCQYVNMSSGNVTKINMRLIIFQVGNGKERFAFPESDTGAISFIAKLEIYA
jgi:hypothetical protein